LPRASVGINPALGTTRVSQYQKGKTNLDLLKQETVSGKSAPRSRQITMPAPLSFLQAVCPSCRPTNSVKALKELLSYVTVVRKLRNTKISYKINLFPKISTAELTKNLQKTLQKLIKMLVLS